MAGRIRFHESSFIAGLLVLLVSSTFLVHECRAEEDGGGDDETGPEYDDAYAMLVFANSSGTVGNVTFVQDEANGSVRIVAHLHGLPPGQHGWHIHEHPSTANWCNASGAHYNSFNRTHGCPPSLDRHVGDLGTILVGPYGRAEVNITVNLISLYPGATNIVNRTLVIHERADDCGQGGTSQSLTTGNSGGRIACGIIRYVELDDDRNDGNDSEGDDCDDGDDCDVQ